MERVEKY